MKVIIETPADLSGDIDRITLETHPEFGPTLTVEGRDGVVSTSLSSEVAGILSKALEEMTG